MTHRPNPRVSVTPAPETGLESGMEKKPELLDVALPWRPFYLQRRILACFAVVFAGLAVTIEALYNHSARNSGLGTADPASRYLWRFAPTTLLTVIVALWSRAEYQTKHAAPWIRLSKGPADVERTLLLDYIAMYQPWAMIQALKNRDYVVACTTGVALILKVLVIISTGLITLTLVDMPNQGIPAMLETAFVNNATALANAGPLALFAMVGIQEDGVAYPDGASTNFAYQCFSSDVPLGTTLKATVDGFSAGLDCDVAQLSLAGVQNIQGTQQFNTSFSAAGCTVAMPISSENFVAPQGSGRNQTMYFARFGRGSCGDSASASDQRIVIVFGTQTIDARSIPADPSTATGPISGSIPQSMQLLCKPTYALGRVDVTKTDDTVLRVAPAAARQDRVLSNVQPWDLAETFFASYKTELAAEYADTTPWFYQPQVLNVDAAMFFAMDLQFRTAGSPVAPASLLDPTTLTGLASSYFQQYAVLLASKSLAQSSTSAITATASLTTERLILGSLVTQLIVSMLGVCAILTIISLFFVPRSGFLPRDPGTVMDMAVLLANSRNLIQALRGAGGADVATVRDRLAGSQYATGVEPYEHAASNGSGYFKILGGHSSSDLTPNYVKSTDKFPYPALLHPVQRLTALFVTVGLIVALDLMLQTSAKNGGLADADNNDPYLYLLWSVIPSLVLGLVAAYFVAVDLTHRVLAPYVTLRQGGASFEQSISLNLADSASPIVLYRSFKLRNISVGGASVAAFMASLFAIFTASLFSAATVPVTAPYTLLSQDFFSQTNGIPDAGFCTTCQNGTILASLVLNGNISYPDFTFEDMTFPTLALMDDDGDLPDDVIVTATVPVVRPIMACKMFSPSQITAAIATSTTTAAGIVNPLRITLAGEAADSATVISTARRLDSFGNPTNAPLDPNAFFGAGSYKPIATANGTVAHWIWVWGQLAAAGTNQTSVKFVSALACNETMEQVNVVTRYVGAGLDIDRTNPPEPDDATITPVFVGIDGNLNYSDLVTLEQTPRHLLDPFFASLVSSQFAIPASALGSADATTLQAVADAITWQHKLIRAQVVSAWNRRPTVSRNTTDQALVFPKDTAGARRVVQDMVSTRILQALLAAALVFGAASWLALPKANDVLPRDPSSIASVAALLADGNIFGLLGRGAEWLPPADLLAFFRDGLHVTMRFQLAWEDARSPRSRRRGPTGSAADDAAWTNAAKDQVFALSAIRTGGWGGGENVGLGMQARVGYAHRDRVRDWGWRT
ncbi:hypothetical protein B0T24DRAFT_539234 [Lasiosphaeria ovina]|uniref:Uncharacterized protein n=1 Tax=Lasiosphaeria ovina TaxID=92902 RepID=A0AAE0JTE5_9PEZI|nr:hypothetical protein B0T24DRAFT_539234 [Lasiosphaeria ovina]